MDVDARQISLTHSCEKPRIGFQTVSRIGRIALENIRRNRFQKDTFRNGAFTQLAGHRHDRHQSHTGPMSRSSSNYTEAERQGLYVQDPLRLNDQCGGQRQRPEPGADQAERMGCAGSAEQYQRQDELRVGDECGADSVWEPAEFGGDWHLQLLRFPL